MIMTEEEVIKLEEKLLEDEELCKSCDCNNSNLCEQRYCGDAMEYYISNNDIEVI